jgi:hypothetical protein
MTKGIIIGIIVIVVLGGGGYLIFHKSPASKPTTPTNSSSSNTSSTSNSSTTATSTSQTPSFTINADDAGADKETLDVSQGAKVSITFNVDEQGTYHGGLEFISTDPAIDSGPIATGASKTVTFTATKSFSFQPYWYASQVKKDYLINVNVS